MPVLVIYGVPPTVDSKELEKIMGEIHNQPHLFESKLPSPNVSIFFPADLVKQGLGEELICSINGLSGKTDVRKKVAKCISDILTKFAKMHIPQCNRVEVYFYPANNGIATLVSNPHG